MMPYYEDEAVTLYHGDCREVLPSIAIAPTVVIADPPYGETSLCWDCWPDGWVAALPASVRQLWCFGSMRMLLTEHARGEFGDFKFKEEIVWEKQNGSGFQATAVRRVHEFVSLWYRGAWGDLTINPQRTDDATARTVSRCVGIEADEAMCAKAAQRLASVLAFGGTA